MQVPRYTLIAEDGSQSWTLRPGVTYTLGSDVLNHIVVDRSAVATRQLEIQVTAEALLVRDAGFAKKTIVDGVRIRGATARLGDGSKLRTGTFDWVVAGPTDADEPTAFSFDRAMIRHAEGAAKTQHLKIWSRGWRGFDGQTLPGLLGAPGGRFWFRVLIDYSPYQDVARHRARIEARDDLLSDLTFDEACRLIRDRKRQGFNRTAEQMLAYPLREMFGPEAALRLLFQELHCMNMAYEWVGPVRPTQQVRDIMGVLRDPKVVVALSVNAGIDREGVDLAIKMGARDPWQMIKRTRVTADDCVELMIAHPTLYWRSDVIAHIREEASERGIARAVAHFLERGDTWSITSLGSRVPGSVTPDLLRVVGDPIPRDVADWIGGADCDAGVAIGELFEAYPERALDVMARLTPTGLARQWPHVGEAAQQAFLERYGPPAEEFEVLPEAAWSDAFRNIAPPPPNQHRYEHTTIDRVEELPAIATPDGFRLPADRQRWLFDSFCEPEWFYASRPRVLPDLSNLVDPRSALRCILHARRDDGRDDFVLRAAVSLLNDARLVSWYAAAREEFTRGQFPHIASSRGVARLLLWHLEFFEHTGHDNADRRYKGSTLASVGVVIDVLLGEMPGGAHAVAEDLLGALALGGYRWPSYAKWQRSIASSWLRETADRVVWVARPSDGGPGIGFRTTPEGPVDERHDDVHVPADAAIHLAHPLDFDKSTARKWVQHLVDNEVVQPFDQFTTAVERVAPAALEDVIGLRWRYPFTFSRSAENESERGFGARGTARVGRRGELIHDVRFLDAAGHPLELSDVDPVVAGVTFHELTVDDFDDFGD